jgi:hypothetical protein
MWRGDPFVISKGNNMVAERNDVDVSKLFEWGKKFTIDIPKTEKKLDLYIRLLGDADVNRAKVYAIKKSRELRGKLKDKDTDEHLAFVQDYSDLTKDNLVEIVTALSIRTLAQQVIKDISIPFPVLPNSDATLEEQEKYQTEVDDYPNKREKAIRDGITKRSEALKKALLKESKEYLIKEYERLLINDLCEEEMINNFRNMSACLGTFLDKGYTKKAFKTVDEFNNLPSEIKQKIIDLYLSLEINVDDLKKSLQVTQ